MRGMAARWDGVAQWFARLAGSVAARVVGLRRGISPDTPLGSPGDSVLLAETGRKTGWSGYVVGCRSGAGAKIGRRARLIQEKKPVEITSIVNLVKSAQLRTYCGKLCKSLPCGQRQTSFTGFGSVSR